MKIQKRGMSLIEVMVTLVIIAIIAGLGYPKYQKMVSRSKQVEAKIFLRAIHMGQDLYKAENGKYADEISQLDIDFPDNDRAVYKEYSIILEDEGSSFVAEVKGNIDSDPAKDVWRITNADNKPQNIANDVIETELVAN